MCVCVSVCSVFLLLEKEAPLEEKNVKHTMRT